MHTSMLCAIAGMGTRAIGGQRRMDQGSSEPNDILYGTSRRDTLDGNAGDDFLDGKQGSDELDAGPGNDTLVYDPDDRRIDGGPGVDTLIVTCAATTLYLPDNRQLANIETIDFSSTTGVVVVLTARSDTSLSSTGTLQIIGSGDVDIPRSNIVDHAPDAQSNRSLTVAVVYLTRPLLRRFSTALTER